MNRYFSIVFVIGSGLAVLGGVLYAPIATAEPYMGFHILLVAFAVVIVGGMGNLTGTFFSAFVLGLVIAITARFWSQAADTMVFAVMALVLLKNSLLGAWRRVAAECGPGGVGGFANRSVESLQVISIRKTVPRPKGDRNLSFRMNTN